MPSTEVAGTELYYERAGEGEPLLLIQGMSATHLAWGRPFRAQLERDFDCVVFDNRGMGLSGRAEEPFTIAEMAADAVGLLDTLGIERAHVLGISMGGMIGQELALAHPERLRSLVLGCTYCGGPEAAPIFPETFRKLAEAWSSGSRDTVIRAMWEINLSPAFRADDSRYAAFAEMAVALPARRRTIELQVGAIAAHDTSARLPGLTTPTLVVHGTVDRLLPAANGPLIAQLVPAARLQMLEDVGHLFWWEQPERAAALVREQALAASA